MVIMNYIDKINKIELEITSGCNAACPGCARTQLIDDLKVSSFTLMDLKRIFPSKESIENKKFKFCGVLGDPAFNHECLGMVEYLTENGGWCQLSTNGGIQSASWWHRMGEISANTNNLNIHFCIDGHRETNSVYRVNTIFKIIERNLQAYVDGGAGKASGSWIFIVFDHNEHEVDAAREHASRLGLQFVIRTGMRNSYHNWKSIIKKKDHKENKILVEEKIISTADVHAHSKKDKIEKLYNFVESYSNNEILDNSYKDSIIKSIKCKLIHEGEIFISSDLRVWPCCFLWNSYFRNSYNIVKRLDAFGSTWNSLNHHSLEDILNHKWYSEILQLSWDPSHDLHIKRCVITCGLNKAYQNELKFDNNKSE